VRNVIEVKVKKYQVKKMIDDRYRGDKMTKKEFILRSIEKDLKEKGKSEKEIQEYLEKAKRK